MCRNPVGEGAKRTATVIAEGWGAREPISTRRRPGPAKNLQGTRVALAVHAISLTTENGAYALCAFVFAHTNKDTDSYDERLTG
jgi:hypothetical protein